MMGRYLMDGVNIYPFPERIAYSQILWKNFSLEPDRLIINQRNFTWLAHPVITQVQNKEIAIPTFFQANHRRSVPIHSGCLL